MVQTNTKHSRLIFVEGTMGSGKSSTATFLSLQLQWNHIKNRYIFEGAYPHPTKITENDSRPKTSEEYVEKSLKKWYQFVIQAQKFKTVNVFDGQLFHGDMTEIMMKNADPKLLNQYVESLIDIVKPLNPTLIYFHQKDIEKAMRKIFDIRGSNWEQHQVEWKTNKPYCKTRALQGTQGLITFYKDFRALTDHIFSNLKIKKLSIENSKGQWPIYCQQILDFIHIEYHKPHVVVDDNDLSKVYDDQKVDLFFKNTTKHPVSIYWLGYGEQKGQPYTTIAPRETVKHTGAIGHLYAIKNVDNDHISETVFVTDKNQVITIQ